MKKRSNLEILVEMLSLCITPQLTTRVMYATSQPWRDLQKRLLYLQAHGLLTVHHSPIKYVTTQKGRELIEKCKQLAELLV